MRAGRKRRHASMNAGETIQLREPSGRSVWQARWVYAVSDRPFISAMSVCVNRGEKFLRIESPQTIFRECAAPKGAAKKAAISPQSILLNANIKRMTTQAMNKAHFLRKLPQIYSTWTPVMPKCIKPNGISRIWKIFITVQPENFEANLQEPEW